MRRLLSFVVVLALVFMPVALSQALGGAPIGGSFLPLSATGATTGLFDGTANNVGIHHVFWTSTGAPTVCTAQLQTAPDNATWTNIGSSFTCTATPASITVSVTTAAAWVRVNLTALSGGASPTISFVLIDTPNSLASGSVNGAVFSVSNTPVATAASIGVATQTFTYTGLNSGDLVLPIGLPTPTALCPPVGFRATAANTLSIDFFVGTAVACTPAAGTYTILVVR